MGTVYLAHDSQLDRLVALKIPKPMIGVDTPWRERFLLEARAAATIQHPNICPAFDVGEVDLQPYLTMAYIEGETLARHLQKGPIPIPEAVRLVAVIARAMGDAHRRGIIHRDLKPANVLIDSRGEPVVMDFGLAHRPRSNDDLQLTLSGVAMGTPQYMSPEQASGEPEAICPASDVYSLGVILNELVTGTVPFQARSFGKLVAQIERDPPPNPASVNPEVDAALEAIILTSLEKSPADRYADGDVFASVLEAYQRGERESIAASRIPGRRSSLVQPSDRARRTMGPGPGRRRLAGWMVFAAAVLAIVGLGSYLLGKYGPESGELSIAQVPASTSPDPPGPPQPPVSYPDQPVRIELPKWMIFAGATRSEFEAWLEERTRDQHSVIWLDAAQVGDRPIFTGVALVESTGREWKALLDVTFEEANDVNALGRRIDGMKFLVTSFSAFQENNVIHCAMLFTEGRKPGCAMGLVRESLFSLMIAQMSNSGLWHKLWRPLTAPALSLQMAVYAEPSANRDAHYGFDHDATQLASFLKSCQNDHYCPISVAAYPSNGYLKFVTTVDDVPTSDKWEADTNLTIEGLQQKASLMSEQGFQPVSVNSYGWDGNVLYTAVWRQVPKQDGQL
jgi:serine/threonine protein kinase